MSTSRELSVERRIAAPVEAVWRTMTNRFESGSVRDLGAQKHAISSGAQAVAVWWLCMDPMARRFPTRA